MAKIEIKGTIEKIVRQDGKVEAQMTVSIPASASMDVPLGAVTLAIQSLQSSMFGKNKPIRGAKSPKDEDED
jgi:hypothetical protein